MLIFLFGKGKEWWGGWGGWVGGMGGVEWDGWMGFVLRSGVNSIFALDGEY